MYYTQNTYEIRCEWGEEGVRRLGPGCDAIVIVDVLSFCTCVDVTVSRGGLVYPYRLRDESAVEYARSLGAELASPYRVQRGGYSLSPASLVGIPAGTRLVLPSPNGAALSVVAAETGVPTFAGCLRNARAVARAAQGVGPRVLVVPAGERWPGGAIRYAAEDLVGAGAIISYLQGEKSPEALVAEQAFHHARHDLLAFVRGCVSGRELLESGFDEDVRLAAELDASESAPVLLEGAYSQ